MVMLLIGGCAFFAVGHRLFGDDHQDPLLRADAIVVLGGEHDGREDYGLHLAKLGYADVVVISDPYGPGDSVMARVCNSTSASFRVICEHPDPSTTRGEALLVQRLAHEYSWRSVIVVSWKFHLVRARYIFGQCFDGAVTMRAVPRTYARPVWRWAYTYAYQFGGLGKAWVVGC
jgi:uncharacterized SAM-binding protein YcdF (DUF218 family)